MRNACRKLFIITCLFQSFLGILYFGILSFRFTSDGTQSLKVSHDRRFIGSRSATPETLEFYSTTEKEARWHALNKLDGNIFRTKNSDVDCIASSIPLPPNIPSISGISPFIGSEYYRFPKHIDLSQKVCQFRRGVSIGNESIKSRNFKLIISSPKLCPPGEIVDILILIKSAITNQNRRNYLRTTWVNDRCWRDRNIRFAFLLGTIQSPTEHKSAWEVAIKREAEHFGDIIMQDFVDHYYNNTYKLLLGLQWSIAYCPEATWLMFVDDDMFINPPQVLSFLNGLDPRLATVLIAGNLQTTALVRRGGMRRSKWSVGRKAFPYETYPKYVQGCLFFLGPHLALDIYIGSRFTDYFAFDDVFIGLILNKLLITPSQINGIHMRTKKKEDDLEALNYMGLHGIRSIHQHLLLWNVTNMAKWCSKY